jgi:hypothetical protein
MLKPISVTVNDEQQVVVQIDGETRQGDVWYLSLQLGADPTQEVPVATEVRRLLSVWMECIAQLTPGQVTWLPFDFSDESTRWLACHYDGCDTHLRFGWSSVEGWAVAPFDSAGYSRAGQTFRADDAAADAIRVYRPFLLNQLRKSMQQL